MMRFSGSIDMSRLPGTKAKQITVVRTADAWFWCKAVLPDSPERDLGPVVLGFDMHLTARWPQDAKALVGGHTEAFLQALHGLLRQRGVIQ